MTNNPYAMMKKNSVMTASPEELTLMLYDGAIKFGNQAKTAIISGEIEKAHNLNLKVQAIIEEFQITLDMDYEVSEGLGRMYDYISRHLIESNIKKDPVILEEALSYIRELRTTWKEAMQIAKGVQQAPLGESRAASVI